MHCGTPLQSIEKDRAVQIFQILGIKIPVLVIEIRNEETNSVIIWIVYSGCNPSFSSQMNLCSNSQFLCRHVSSQYQIVSQLGHFLPVFPALWQWKHWFMALIFIERKNLSNNGWIWHEIVDLSVANDLMINFIKENCSISLPICV
jgi:hypothetical protein